MCFRQSCGVCTLLKSPTPELYHLLYRGRQQDPTMRAPFGRDHSQVPFVPLGSIVAFNTPGLRADTSGYISDSPPVSSGWSCQGPLLEVHSLPLT